MGKRIEFKPSRSDSKGIQKEGAAEGISTALKGGKKQEPRMEQEVRIQLAPQQEDPEASMDAAAFQRFRMQAEQAGAKVIADAYLDSLGEVGQACASTKFLPEMRKRILEMIEKGWGPHGPRNFDTERHFKKLRNIVTNREETVLMRYKAGCRLGYAQDRFAAQITIEPFDPAEWIRKPRHASHYRFIVTVGALSDYQYSPSAGVYVPLHPELVGVNGWNHTAPIPIHEKLEEQLRFEAHLPGYPELPPTARLVVGWGIEFLFQGKNAAFMKSVYRALMVIDVI